MQVFKVTPHDVRTLSWWYAHKDLIEFEPTFQRQGTLWTMPMRQRLIDTVLNGFDIPKIYLADFSLGQNPLNSSGKLYAIIDGRQRFETLFGFAQDTFALAEDFSYRPDPTLDLAGRRLSEIRKDFPLVAADFDNYNLGVMSVITNDQSLINEMFLRLNSSKPLTGAEYRNAMAGIVPDLIRALSEHPFYLENIGFDIRRLQNQNSAAKILFTEFSGSFTSTKRRDLDGFVEQFADQASLVSGRDVQDAYERSRRVLDDMRTIFSFRDPILKSEGSIVVFYWLIRNYAADYRERIRPLLEFFTESRSARQLLEAGRSISEDIFEYRTLLRNANDAGSLRGRYLILERWLLSDNQKFWSLLRS